MNSAQFFENDVALMLAFDMSDIAYQSTKADLCFRVVSWLVLMLSQLASCLK